MAVPVQAQVLPLRECLIYHQWSRTCGSRSILDSRMGGGSTAGRPQRRQPKAVSFDKVTVYMFPRVQGFASVPTRGGDTLGIDFKHTEEYTRILRGYEGQSCGPPGDDLPSEASLFYDATSPLSAAVRRDGAMPQEAGDGDEERSGRQQLKPLQWRHRRQLLRDSGVRSLDFSETEACRAIRTSRERCGCSCIDQCLPETCSCSLNGIACQMASATHGRRRSADLDACWAVPVAAACIAFLSCVTTTSYGYLYVLFMQKYQLRREEAAWPHSALVISGGCVGLLVSVLQKKFSLYHITLVGGLVASAGVLASNFAPNIAWLSVTFGVIQEVAALAGVAGLGQGYIICMQPLLVTDHVGLEWFSLCCGIGGLVSVPVVLSGPAILGFFRDKRGSYDRLYLLLAGLNLTVAILLTALVLQVIIQRRHSHSKHVSSAIKLEAKEMETTLF